MKLKFHKVLAERAHIRDDTSPESHLTYQEWSYANDEANSGTFARFETYYGKIWNTFRGKEEAKIDREPERALAAKCWGLKGEDAKKLWKMHMA